MSLDNKLKWKQSFQKSKSLSQSSINASRKASLLEDETSDQELQDYLESLKRKSGISGLWTGEKFDKVVRDDEDKTPDISISSSDNEGEEIQSFHSDIKQDDYSDDDFKPNIVMLPESLSDPKDDLSDVSSGELFHGVQLANFDLSDGETKEEPKSTSLNNEDLSKSASISEPKDINAIMNNLHLASEIETEDEVAEEIVDDVDIDETIPQTVDKDSTYYSSFQSSPEPNRTDRESTTPSGRRSRNRPRSRAKSATSVEQSYTMDFSTADEPSTISEKTESLTQSSRRSRSSHRSRSSRSSRSSHTSRSSHRTKSYRSHSSISDHSSVSYDKPKSSHDSKQRTIKVIRDKNSHVCDIGVQTGFDMDQGLRLPSGLGVGMATSGQSIGMQYVDPSPIATHAVSAEALEAVTAYNPAVVALTDMLKQQIRLVQQFVDANNRMYQAYTTSLNTQYRYTTLEDTLEFIEKNKPRSLTLKEALRQIKDDEET
ncbi:uncharacterized protein C19orf44 homolog [Actinia tenebrosa]|uniref:Uncharacterized protein C19orf44 homolog n=1 Tax=Actinia tenebrosa TaxID=6105 RepID=A0A6P8HFJ7_ACTTE|nr:uncharacterized protein C19orf44 homolog [Actinia tenebrosa]